jgi:hypothetical protein
MTQEHADPSSAETMSETTRFLLARLECREAKRAADRERLGQEGLRMRQIARWQADSLREFHKLLALQFEALAWEHRARKPVWSSEALNIVVGKRRGLAQRLAKARRDAAEGCRSQADWLVRHAELIHALEHPPEFPRGRFCAPLSKSQ